MPLFGSHADLEANRPAQPQSQQPRPAAPSSLPKSVEVDDKLRQAHQLLDETRDAAQDNIRRALATAAEARHLEVQCQVLEQEARIFERTTVKTRKRYASLSRRGICGLALAILIVAVLVMLVLVIKL